MSHPRGITYRQDVADTRYSASEILAKELIKSGAEVSYHDPLVKYWEEMEMDTIEQLTQTSNYDAIVLAVGHSEYKEFQPSFWSDSKLILDANMVLDKYQINRMRDIGIKTESIGRGDQR